MSSRLKVMHIVGSKDAGGAETFYLRLVKSLQKHCDVFPVVRKGSWIAENLEKEGLNFHVLPFGGIFDFETKARLKRLIDVEIQPDVIQTWMNRASKFLPKTAAPVVGRMGGYYNLKYYKTADWLGGNTKGICDYIRSQGWPENRIVYLPNFAPEPILNSSKTREELVFSDDAYVFLMAGRLHENKGFDVAFKALSAMPENTHFLVAGEGNQKEELETILKERNLENRVTFTGWTNDISGLANCADAWLIPSRHEPLGNVVLDAWMHKKPVIAAAADGPKSLIQEGKTGLLVPIEDDIALAEAATKIINDPEKSKIMADAGYAYAKQHFSEEAVLQQYMDFYTKIIQEKEEVA